MAGYQRKGKKYSKISYQKRVELLDLILNQREKITETAKKLHLKLPTVKAILSNYRKNNHIFQRKVQTIPHEEDISEIQNNQAIDVSREQQRISSIEAQKNLQNQNALQINTNILYQYDQNYMCSLWYGNLSPWSYFYTPYGSYQF